MSKPPPNAKGDLKKGTEGCSCDQEDPNDCRATDIAERETVAGRALTGSDRSSMNDSGKLAIGIVQQRLAYHRDESFARRQQSEEDQKKHKTEEATANVSTTTQDSSKVAIGIVQQRVAYHRDESFAKRLQSEEKHKKLAQYQLEEEATANFTSTSGEYSEELFQSERAAGDCSESDAELIRRVTSCSIADVPGAFSVDGIGGSENTDTTIGDTHGGIATSGQDPEQQGHENPLLETPIIASLVRSQTESEQQDLQAQLCLEEALEVVSVASSKRTAVAPSRLYVWMWLILCLILAVAAFVAVVVLSTNKKEEPPDDSQSDNSNATTVPIQTESADTSDNLQVPLVLEDYPPWTIRAMQRNPTGPQAMANAWLYNDPNLDSYPRWRKYQRFALGVKFFALDGPNWLRNDHWMSYGIHECAWYTSSEEPDIICNEDGHMRIEDLRRNNLGGSSLPREAFMCPFIVYFDHSHNNVHGQFPPLASSSIIEVFRWSNNSLDGPLVVEQGFEVTSLRIIEIDGNNFVGPFYLPAFPALEILNISGNSFDGTIANRGMEVLSELQIMDLSENAFSGTLPSEIGHLSSLGALDLSGNERLSGRLPNELEEIHSLTFLDISDTGISGEIPADLCTGNSTGAQTILAECSTTLECCR
ncbi:Leucine Rich Repeat [Seminavis robusta]|uniref:Leucine Rich Repeat n=1 Tax=Seminavis robusta TaxID=568900 RepID=A0A9N8HDN7_9STRA|nr:Leucine Rich Repeat [Seminavis robusta]|eukprot:Sro435_g142380.1 Leucine Rich Repeat (648) ;mRNA; r:42564-44598